MEDGVCKNEEILRLEKSCVVWVNKIEMEEPCAGMATAARIDG